MLRFTYLLIVPLTLSACSTDSNTHLGNDGMPDARGSGGAGSPGGAAGGGGRGDGAGGALDGGRLPDASVGNSGGTTSGFADGGSGGGSYAAGASGGASTGYSGGGSGNGGGDGDASGGFSGNGTNNGGTGGTNSGGKDGSGGISGNGGAGGTSSGGSDNGGTSSGGAADAGPCKMLTLKPLSSTLTSPVFATAPKGDARIFVLERTAGRISVLDAAGTKLGTFLDISKNANSAGFEAGVLGLAFHPSFATNGVFYVTYTTASVLRVSRFTASAPTANTADAATESVVLESTQDSHHNTGGALAFGPDGMLYIAIGDGSDSTTGQDLTVLPAKMLRIAVDPVTPGYTIPKDNPFVASATARHEIWALGLREPYRFAFDPPSGSLYIADVGDSAHEEIDVVPASKAGLDFGWPIMEGTYCHTPATGCDRTGLTLPVYDYPHVNNESAIIGANVYRGAALSSCYRGSYVFGDYPSGLVDTLHFVGTTPVVAPTPGFTDPNLLSFGQDGNGELLVINDDQAIYRIVSE